MGYVLRDPRRLWPKGIIPYELTAGPYRDNALAAFNEYNTRLKTVVYFRPRNEFDKKWLTIKFYDEGPASSSSLGMTAGTGAQEISINVTGNREVIADAGGEKRGNLTGVLIHELGHAIGLDHEHQRPDRDQYVCINWQNVRPGRYSDFCNSGPTDIRMPDGPISLWPPRPGPAQFLSDALQPWDCQKSGNRPDPAMVMVGPYDIDSVMHYLNNQASFRRDLTTIDHCVGGKSPVQKKLDDGRIVTTIAPGHRTTRDVGQLLRLSDGDIAAIRSLSGSFPP